MKLVSNVAQLLTVHIGPIEQVAMSYGSPLVAAA